MSVAEKGKFIIEDTSRDNYIIQVYDDGRADVINERTSKLLNVRPLKSKQEAEKYAERANGSKDKHAKELADKNYASMQKSMDERKLYAVVRDGEGFYHAVNVQTDVIALSTKSIGHAEDTVASLNERAAHRYIINHPLK